MTRISDRDPRRRVVIGVDTHKHVHVAAALDELGTVLQTRRFPADSAGYRDLLTWAGTFGPVLVFGIEGTGSCAASPTPWTPRTPPAP